MKKPVKYSRPRPAETLFIPPPFLRSSPPVSLHSCPDLFVSPLFTPTLKSSHMLLVWPFKERRELRWAEPLCSDLLFPRGAEPTGSDLSCQGAELTGHFLNGKETVILPVKRDVSVFFGGRSFCCSSTDKTEEKSPVTSRTRTGPASPHTEHVLLQVNKPVKPNAWFRLRDVEPLVQHRL
ncbi:unnamed protein product [Leuciscus chuanchicus]